jgi:hypothetical protein
VCGQRDFDNSWPTPRMRALRPADGCHPTRTCCGPLWPQKTIGCLGSSEKRIAPSPGIREVFEQLRNHGMASAMLGQNSPSAWLSGPRWVRSQPTSQDSNKAKLREEIPSKLAANSTGIRRGQEPDGIIKARDISSSSRSECVCRLGHLRPLAS